MTIGTATQNAVSFALSLGLVGGASLIAAFSLTKNGPVIYLTYAAIVLACAIYLRVERVQPFAKRFALSLAVFMFGNLALYLFIGLVQAKTLFVISLLGHAWRLGFVFLIGAALSAAVAQLTATQSQP